MGSYEDKVSAFFLGYIKPIKEWYKDDGNLSDECIKAAARILIEQGVFDTPDDMRREAMAEYGIILPDNIFYKKEAGSDERV